jgi:predicted MFS family arabinose efflux permease
MACSLVKDIFDDSQSQTILLVLDVGGILGMVVIAILLAELLNITAIGWRYGFVILGGLSVLASGGGISVLLKNPRRHVSAESPGAKTPPKLTIWFKEQFLCVVEILKHPIVWFHMLLGSLVTTTVNTLIIFSVTWLVDIKHLTRINAPFIFAAMLVAMAVGGQAGAWVASLAETRWPKVGRIAATQAAMLVALPVMDYLVQRANSLPIIMLAAIFVSFFLNWNRHSLQQPHFKTLIRPDLQNKAAFWTELVQAAFAAVMIVNFSHYADNRNLTAMLRILVIDFWAAALVLTTAYYVIYPLELRRR